MFRNCYLGQPCRTFSNHIIHACINRKGFFEQCHKRKYTPSTISPSITRMTNFCRLGRIPKNKTKPQVRNRNAPRERDKFMILEGCPGWSRVPFITHETATHTNAQKVERKTVQFIILSPSPAGCPCLWF